MKQLRIETKRGALELSIGTIVIIVIAMTMLILGIVLVQQVMCAGIIITDQVTTETESQIVDLFGSQRSGISCAGEGSNIPTFSADGLVPVLCQANFDFDEECDFTITEITVSSGRIGQYDSGDNLMRTPVVQGDGQLKKYSIGPSPTTIKIETLNIPENSAQSSINMVVKAECNSLTQSYNIDYQIQPVGAISAAIC